MKRSHCHAPTHQEPAWDCVIRAKGPEGMEEGPIGDFFRNYTTFYTVVSTHVGKCDKCCPQAMLQRWQRLRNVRNGGKSSRGLLGMALKTERQALKKGRPVQKETVDWFIVKAFDVGKLIQYEARFSDEALEEALRGTFDFWKEADLVKPHARDAMEVVKRSMRKPGPGAQGQKEPVIARGKSIYWAAIALAEAFDRGVREFPEGNIMDLAKVAEVMCS